MPEVTLVLDVELEKNVITQLYKTIQLPNDTVSKKFHVLNHVLDDGLRVSLNSSGDLHMQ